MQEFLFKILICLIASLFAGVGTGFVGISAAVSITPLLMGFLSVDHYDATTIALASDVLASAFAAVIYKRRGNVDIKGAILLVITVLIFTFVGTVAGYFIPSNVMGWTTIVAVLLLGLKLIFFPSKESDFKQEHLSKKKKTIYSLVFGVLIGFVCGFAGAGGGMMLLLVLTGALGYEMHMAVGTSVTIMTFSALFGSIFHLVFEHIMVPTPATDLSHIDLLLLLLCIGFTLIFSVIGSSLANKMSEKVLNLVSGIMLVCIAASVCLVNVLA